jgi:hypothetical protein
VGAGIAGLSGQLLGRDLADDPRVVGVGLRVQHVGAGGADPWYDQVAPLQWLAVVAVALVAQGAGAGLPTEVVQLVAGRRQLGEPDHAPVGRGGRVGVDHGHGVPGPAGRVVGGHVRQPLRRGGDRLAGASVKRRIGPLGRDLPPMYGRAFLSSDSVALPSCPISCSPRAWVSSSPGSTPPTRNTGTKASRG